MNFTLTPRGAVSKALLTAASLATLIGPVMSTAAMAQNAPPSYQDPNAPAYNGQTPQTYQGQPYQGQSQQAYSPPPEPGAPQGYAPGQTPPPPPGYSPEAPNAQQRYADQQYAANAQQWAAQNCVRSQGGDPVAGAVIGGIFGAIVGGGLGGRHDGGAGALVGGVVGAGAGAAIAGSGNGATSPGCPPGYVLRQGAAAYGYAPDSYYYAAPSWYVPWVFINGAWLFRPYPYHDWYWRTYRGGYYRGYYGRPGYYRGGHYTGGRGGGYHGRR